MTWRGQWIWIEGDSSPRNAYVHFRRKLNLDFVPPKAMAWLTADSRYIFWVNGKLVSRGPSRCDPRYQSYDEVDLAPFLREGENTLAVLMHHYGESTYSYIQGRAGFLFECSALNSWSDGAWRAKLSDAWCRDLSRMRVQLDFPEIFDARQEPAGWMEPGFDDSRWAAAMVIGSPPCAPWLALEKREIPFNREEEIGGAKVIETGQTETLGPVEVLDLQKFFRMDQLMISGQVAYAATHIEAPASQSIELELTTAQALRLWVNDEMVLPELINGRKRVSVSLRAGWNRVLLKLPQGHHQWKVAVRFDGADRMTRAWQLPVNGAGIQPGWAVSGPYRTLHDDHHATLEEVFPPEQDEASADF